MMFQKLVQILVSVLDLVSKSHAALTIARLRLAIVNATSDLETTSKTLIIIFGIYTRCQYMKVKVVCRKFECREDVHYKTHYHLIIYIY